MRNGGILLYLSYLFGSFLGLDKVNGSRCITTIVKFSSSLGGTFEALWIKASDAAAALGSWCILRRRVMAAESDSAFFLFRPDPPNMMLPGYYYTWYISKVYQQHSNVLAVQQNRKLREGMRSSCCCRVGGKK
jgi:hypothetical protein